MFRTLYNLNLKTQQIINTVHRNNTISNFKTKNSKNSKNSLASDFSPLKVNNDKNNGSIFINPYIYNSISSNISKNNVEKEETLSLNLSKSKKTRQKFVKQYKNKLNEIDLQLNYNNDKSTTKANSSVKNSTSKTFSFNHSISKSKDKKINFKLSNNSLQKSYKNNFPVLYNFPSHINDYFSNKEKIKTKNMPFLINNTINKSNYTNSFSKIRANLLNISEKTINLNPNEKSQSKRDSLVSVISNNKNIKTPEKILNSVKKNKKRCSMTTDKFLEKDKLAICIFQERKKIFKHKEKKDFSPNILNILYSENKEQFNKFYSKHVKKEKLKGLSLSRITSSPDIIMNKINLRMNKMKNKLSLIKSIIDYSYPEIVIRQFINQANDFNKKMKKIKAPYKEALIAKSVNELKKNKYYSSLLSIHNYNNNHDKKKDQNNLCNNLIGLKSKKRNRNISKMKIMKSFNFDTVSNINI